MASQAEALAAGDNRKLDAKIRKARTLGRLAKALSNEITDGKEDLEDFVRSFGNDASQTELLQRNRLYEIQKKQSQMRRGSGTARNMFLVLFLMKINYHHHLQ